MTRKLANTGEGGGESNSLGIEMADWNTGFFVLLTQISSRYYSIHPPMCEFDIIAMY